MGLAATYAVALHAVFVLVSQVIPVPLCSDDRLQYWHTMSENVASMIMSAQLFICLELKLLLSNTFWHCNSHSPFSSIIYMLSADSFIATTLAAENGSIVYIRNTKYLVQKYLG